MSKDSDPVRRAAVNIHVSPAESHTVLPTTSPLRDFTANARFGIPADSRADQIAQEEQVKLVQRVFLGPSDCQPRVVVFAGIDSGNGCSRVCRRAAEVLAGASSGTVCLVDADLRSLPPRRNGGTPHVPEGSESVALEGPVRTYVHSMGAPNLWLLERGSILAAHSTPITSDAVQAKLLELRKEFDRVLIDAPPLNLCSDAIAMAQSSDGLILVIEADATRRETARDVTDNLRRAGVHILGAVLNKRTFPIPEKLYRRL